MGRGRYVLNAHGAPVEEPDLLTWVRWFETNADARRVAQDQDEGPDGLTIRVSTVFLGLDHNFGQGPPVLWETLVFGGVLDGEMERYTSRADALVGHQAMCQRVNATLQRPARVRHEE